MFSNAWWGGFVSAIVLCAILAMLLWAVQVGRVRLYNYEPMQQTCVVQDKEVVRCYAKEPQ